MENMFLRSPEVRMLANAIFGNVIFSASSENQKNKKLSSLPHSKDTSSSSSLSPIFELNEYYKKWLLSLDDNPKQLLEWIGEEKQKLGIYHEKLWQFFLEKNGRTKLISHNLKVKDVNNDIGEFDLIYTDHLEKLFHLEIANKYYLAINDNTESRVNWVGPNKIDSLEKKINHTLNNQIKLSETSYGKEKIKDILKQKNQLSLINKPIIKQIQIGGRLFYPYSHKKTTFPTPNSINNKHSKGCWFTLGEWELINNQSDMQYKIIKKPLWLDYFFCKKDFMSGKKNPIELNYDQPKMVFYFIGSERKKGNFGFIVPENWNRFY